MFSVWEDVQALDDVEWVVGFVGKFLSPKLSELVVILPLQLWDVSACEFVLDGTFKVEFTVTVFVVRDVRE